MDNIYLFVLVILMALAISDLVVGVSNDAVNFLNSALGSKAAPRYVILLVASAGILLGSIFSSGMMEVARRGVFFPENFYFHEMMMIFLAVMFTDVILLDMFNTFGLPTSTTVSLVFELLGSAVAVALVKIWNAGGSMAELPIYINSGKALGIISGILTSVIVAFITGTVVMYVTRPIGIWLITPYWLNALSRLSQLTRPGRRHRTISSNVPSPRCSEYEYTYTPCAARSRMPAEHRDVTVLVSAAPCSPNGTARSALRYTYSRSRRSAPASRFNARSRLITKSILVLP